MVDGPNGLKRLAVSARWILAAALAAYLVFDAVQPDDAEAPPLEEPAAADGDLAITRIKPVEVTPRGSAVLALSGIDEHDPSPVVATVDKVPAEIVYRRGREVVVRVPDSILGHRKLRVQQGDRKSKSRDIWVKPIARRKVIYNLIGGLALFVLGLRMLQQGLRTYAGRTLRNTIARWTGSSSRGLGLGVLAGVITQSTASSAGVLVSLFESRLLLLGPALAMLLGAQVGAAAMVLVLPLGSTREGLLVVALGVLWMGLSMNRRSGAFGGVVLGVGLLLYGVQLLRVGFQPIVSDPALLPYVRNFTAPGVPGLLASATAGAAITTLTQGPGPVFALTLGLAESSGLIGTREGLAILGGTALGGAISAAIVVWPFGREARRVAVAYLLVGVALTVAVLGTLPAWRSIASSIVAGSPETAAWGRKRLFPNVAAHLAAGFVASQFALGLGLLPVLPGLSMFLDRLAFKSRAGSEPVGEDASAEFCMERLGSALDAFRRALEATTIMAKSRDRTNSGMVDLALAEARSGLDGLLAEFGARSGAHALSSLAGVAMALSQLHEAARQLGRLVEEGIEDGIELDGDDVQAIDALERRVAAAFAVLRSVLAREQLPNVEAARVLEIRINAEELGRRHAVTERPTGGERTLVLRRIHVTNLLAAYEAIGNHLFRSHEAIAGELD